VFLLIVLSIFIKIKTIKQTNCKIILNIYLKWLNKILLDILYESSHARKVLFKSHNQIIILLRISFYSLAEKYFQVITFSVYSSLLNDERSVVFSFLYRENYQLFGPRLYWISSRMFLGVERY